IGLALWYGEAYLPAEAVDGVYVEDSSVAYEMGLRTGDRIVAVNGRPLERFTDAMSPEAFAADPYRLTVERNEQTVELTGPDQIISKISRAERFGIGFYPSVLGTVAPGTPAEAAGVRPRDRNLAGNGPDARQWPQLTALVQDSGGRPLTLRYARPDSLV